MLLQLLLLSNICTAANENDNDIQRKMARLLLARFVASTPSSTSTSTSSSDAGNTGLRFLKNTIPVKDMAVDKDVTTDMAKEFKTGRGEKANGNGSGAMPREFGPGADWSCTAEANRGFDYDSCTLSEASKSVEGGCSWCPLGSSAGVCLRAGQAALLNGQEEDSLLHLRCYNDNDTEQFIDETATAFWDEAMACFPHSKTDCGGDHGNGDHKCIYCHVAEPEMGLCLSVDLWDDMVVVQAVEDFDEDVNTSDQIRLDQVIHCGYDHAEDPSGGLDDESLWNNRCGWNSVDTDAEEADCLSKEGCAIATNPFPGLFGTASGGHCVSTQQERALMWVVGLLQDEGWREELSDYQ